MISLTIVVGVFLLLAYIVTLILRDDKPFAYDGEIIITVHENSKKTISLELNVDPDEFEKKKFVTFKIVEAEPSVE